MRPLRIAHLGTGSFRIMLLLYCARIEAQHRQHDDIVLVTPQPSPEKESLRPQFQTNEWGEPIYIHNPMSIGHSEIYVKKALQDRPPIPVATSLKEVCSLSKTIRFPPEPKARSPGIYPCGIVLFLFAFLLFTDLCDQSPLLCLAFVLFSDALLPTSPYDHQALFLMIHCDA